MASTQLGAALLSLAATVLPAELSAQQEPAAGGVDLTPDQHDSIRDVFAGAGQTLDDWIDQITLSGFVAARYFDTDRGGARPDGALGIQAASLFVDAQIRDVGRAFIEMRLDYFQEAGQNDSGVGETYMQFDGVLGGDDGIGVKVGRFDLAFSEWYQQEDPNRNRMIGFPAAILYRWDEGIQAYADYGDWGFVTSITDGTYSRNSQSGIAPAVTGRLHARPCEQLYLSASGLYIHSADASAICFGGSVITPVTGGASGASPSTEVRSALGCADVIWQPCSEFNLHLTGGGGRISDDAPGFGRSIWWWVVEPSYQFAPQWRATCRYSGVGTFDNQRGYAFESRPYGNGVASYGFDLQSLQRAAVGLSWEIAPGLQAKAEVGVDLFEATRVSGRPYDSRTFSAAELVLTF